MQPALDEFVSWPVDLIAQQVRSNGLKVCVFAVNGTRRWFRLENPNEKINLAGYLDAMVDVHIRLSRLLFEHGIETVVLPVFGPELLDRNGYEDIAWNGLHRLATDPRLLEYYAAQDVRVRFYGDFADAFQTPPWSELLAPFSNLREKTACHMKNRLFLGACAQDAAEAIIKKTLEYYRENGQAPSRSDLVKLYYGENIDPANLFIGFDSFSAFDMPLLDVGSTALYFTVCPSPYLTTTQLREILYDYLFMRSAAEFHDPMKMDQSALENMRSFYNANRKQTQGIGFLMDGIWYPSSHVRTPPGMHKRTVLPTTGELGYQFRRR